MSRPQRGGARNTPVAGGDVSQVQSSSPSQPWGLISLGFGALALFMTTAGCLFGMSYVALPFAIIGVAAAELEIQKARRGQFAERSQATMGIVFSTVAFAIQLVFIGAGLLVFVGYILFFLGMAIFA